MANDIAVAVSGVDINDISIVCSTLPTGKSSKLVVANNTPADLTISNIQSKFDARFDDPSYYHGYNP